MLRPTGSGGMEMLRTTGGRVGWDCYVLPAAEGWKCYALPAAWWDGNVTPVFLTRECYADDRLFTHNE